MSNTYSKMTAEKVVPCTLEEYQGLRRLLYVNGDEEAAGHGITMDWLGDQPGAYIYAPEQFEAEEIPEAFLKEIGRLLAAAGSPHLELGVAITCDVTSENSHGGTYFRIYPDGALKEIAMYWPARDGKNNIIVEVSGGLVCTVYADQGLVHAQCDVLDRDNEKATVPEERDEFKVLDDETEGMTSIYG